MQEESCVILNYYPIRAKGQISRLICQDRFFDPDQWQSFKEKEGKEWVIKDIPFLQDGDFVVTGPIGIATYLVEKAGRQDLFGRSIEDKTKIDSIRSHYDLRTAMIGMACSTRQQCEKVNKQQKINSILKTIKPYLLMHEQECQLNPWFFPYITIMDFVIYQLINQLERICPEHVQKLTKLYTLRERVRKLPEIQSYEHSERAVRQFCPLNYFNQFREEKLSRSRASSSGSSTSSQRSSNRDMDIQ